MTDSSIIVESTDTTYDATSVDSYFIEQVEEFIQNEIAVLDPEDKEGRFLVYQTAFQMIVDQCPTMSALLSSIGNCYFQVINMFTNQSRAKVGKEALLGRAINCQASIKHHQKNIASMEDQIAILKQEKGELQTRLEQTKKDISDRKELLFPKLQDDVPNHLDEREMKYFNLTALDEEGVEMDTTKLEERLKQLQNLLETSSFDIQKFWVPLKEFEKLEQKTQNLASRRHDVAHGCSSLYVRYERLRCAAIALREVVSDEGRVATVGEAILKTFKAFKPDKKESFVDFLLALSDNSSNYKGDFTGKPTETIAPDVDASLADWLRKTHKLLSNGHYKEAAETAAAAPSGILCNTATLYAFKAALPDEQTADESNIPVLFYLEAAFGPLTTSYSLTETFTEACVAVALSYDCFWLVSSWLAKKRLSLSTKIVNMLILHNDPKYLPLAEALCRQAITEYQRSDEFSFLLLECLLLQNRSAAAVVHVRQYQMDTESCAAAVFRNPCCSKFLFEIAQQAENKLESVFSILETLPNIFNQSEDWQTKENFKSVDSSNVLDDDLLVQLIGEKRHNPEIASKLQGLAKTFAECELENLAARLSNAAN